MNTENLKREFENESLNMTKYLPLFLSYWYLFIFSLCISLTIAYLINRYSQPTYTVTTTLLITDQSSTMAGVESLIEELGIFRKIDIMKMCPVTN